MTIYTTVTADVDVQVPHPPTAYDAVIGIGDTYNTIQPAVDDGAKSLLVASAYDPTDETYPVEVKADGDEWTPLTLHGVGPNAATIGDPTQEADTIQIHGNKNNYGRPVNITNLSLAGHPDYTVVKAACLSGGLIEKVIIEDSGHAITLNPSYVDDYVGGSFDWTIRDTDIWRCQSGVTLNIGSAAHNVLMDKVDITACRGVGVSAENAGSVTFQNGVVQMNGGWGFEVRHSPSFTIENAYIEGNSRRRDYPIEIYGKGADSLTIRDSYFHGINPRGARGHDYSWVQRAVNLHNSEGAAVRDCKALRYGDCFAAAFGADLIVDNVSLGEKTRKTVTEGNVVGVLYG